MKLKDLEDGKMFGLSDDQINRFRVNTRRSRFIKIKKFDNHNTEIIIIDIPSRHIIRTMLGNQAHVGEIYTPENIFSDIFSSIFKYNYEYRYIDRIEKRISR